MTQTWLFQSNPNRFRFDEFLESLAAAPINTVWLARQHQREIEPGDEVYIWRGIGKRKENRHLAGVVAKATILERVKDQADDPHSRRYWVDPAEGTMLVPRVAIRITDYTSARDLRLDAIKENPALKNLAVMRIRRGTNFPVTVEEAKAIETLF